MRLVLGPTPASGPDGRADDHAAARSALAAARLDAPGGRDELVALLEPAAERYATGVLCLPDRALVGVVVPAAVARAVKTLPRDLGPDELADHLHGAVRHEVWRRQAGRGPATRILAAAALVLVVVAMGAVALVVGGALGDDPPSASVAAVRTTPVALGGRVVDTTTAGTVLGGRADVEVAVVADGATVGTTTTDASGRFEVADLAPGTYQVRLGVPSGLRLRGAADGRSTTVDLTERSRARIVLELQRS